MKPKALDDIKNLSSEFPNVPLWIIIELYSRHGNDLDEWKRHSHFMARCGECRCEFCEEGLPKYHKMEE